MIPRLFLFLLLALAIARAQSSDAGTTVNSLANPAGTGARPTPRDIHGLVPSISRPSTLQTPAPKLSPVFFPAVIPALNAPLPPEPAVRDSIWNDLGPYANELFFAPLSTRLSAGELNRRTRQQLDAYTTARATALEHLRTALANQLSPSPALDAEINQLYATADTLRRDLYRGSFLISNTDWNAYRNWRLGDKNKRSAQELLYDEFSVLRAAVYFQEGLSIDQRHLLREVVFELSEAIGNRRETSLDSFEPTQVIFFLPHGSRLTLPAGLPDDTSELITRFTALKNTLKRELREQLFTLDSQSESRREKQLEQLATQQAPHFAELETLAQSIRVGLAALPTTAPTPARSDVPRELATRINRYLEEKADVQRSVQQLRDRPSDQGAPTRAELAGFEQKNQARLAALADEARAIRTEVARLNSSNGARAKTVDALLADFLEAFKYQQLEALYADYRTAVLSPVLSAPQRQLLFDAAIASLNLAGIKDWQAVPE